MTFLTLLLALPLFGGGELATPAPALTDEVESVLRRYDLTTIARDIYIYTQQQSLLPACRTDSAMGTIHKDSSIHDDLIRRAILALVGDELEYEGRRIWEDGDGLMAILAPEAVQARIAGLLDFLSAAANSTTELRIDVVYLPHDGTGQGGPVGIVDEVVAARALAMAEDSAKTESYTLQVCGNSTAQLNLTTEHSFIGDYDVEVADSTFCFDPQPLSLSSGMRVEVGAYPAPGGCNLALFIRHGLPTGPVGALTQGVAGKVSAENGVHYYDGPKQIHTLSIAQRTYVLNTALPDGKALILRSSLDLNDESSTQYLIVRRVGSMPPAVFSTSIGNDSGEIHLIRTHALSPARFTFHGDEFRRGGFSTYEAKRRTWDEEFLTTKLDYETYSLEQDVLTSLHPHLEFSDGNSWFLSRPNGAEDPRSGERDLASTVADIQSPSEVVNVSIQALLTGEGLSRQVSCDIPLRLGFESAVVMGVEGTRLCDYDVEIAKGSTVADPIVILQIDGMALLMRVDRAADGGFDLALRGVVNLLANSTVFDPHAKSIGSLEQRAYNRLELTETVHIDADGNGTTVIGNTGGGEGGGVLEFRVQVR